MEQVYERVQPSCHGEGKKRWSDDTLRETQRAHLPCHTGIDLPLAMKSVTEEERLLKRFQFSCVCVCALDEGYHTKKKKYKRGIRAVETRFRASLSFFPPA